MKKYYFFALIVFSFSVLVATAQNPQFQGYNPKTMSYMIYQKAMQAFQIGDFNQCIALCAKGLAFNNKSKELAQLQALAYAGNGDNSSAERMFQGAITLDYNYLDCRNNYGVFLKKLQRLDEAKHQFEECIRINPKYDSPYVHIGEIAQEKGDLQTALDNYQTAVNLNPKNFEAQKLLGLAIYEKATSGLGGEIYESLEKLKEAEKILPNNPLIHYYIGYIACANGELDNGEVEYRLALMYDPKMAKAHYELGKLRYLRGDPDRCLSEMLEVEKINPSYTELKKYPNVDLIKIKQYEAKAYELTDDLLNAIEAYKSVQAMRKNDKELAKHITKIDKELRTQAHSHKKEAYDIKGSVEALQKGLKATDNNHLTDAQSDFAKALELWPLNFRAKQQLGFIEEINQHLDLALSTYDKVIEMKPDYDGLYYNKGYILEKQNLLAEAGLEYQKFHELAHKYPYDPKHVVSLQQEDARIRARAQQLKERGY